MHANLNQLTITVESCGWSQIGTRRTENQDAFLNLAQNGIWAVADGVGESEKGGIASKLIINSLTEMPKPTTFDEHIDNTLHSLKLSNTYLRQYSKIYKKTTASTVAALLIHNNYGACLWAGDSRCYLFRNGTLYQCTKDHTLRQEIINNKKLTANEVSTMVNGNAITNAIGCKDNLYIEQVRFNLCPGDRFLLCSDGLLKCIEPESLTLFLNKNTLSEMVKELTQATNDLAQPDNITVIIITLSYPDDAGFIWP